MAELSGVIIDADPLLGPLTGIGQYTRHLTSGLLLEAPDLELKLFAHGAFLPLEMVTAAKSGQQETSPQQRPYGALLKNLRKFTARSKLAINLYRRWQAQVCSRRLAKYADTHLYHSPNYILPHYAGKTIVTIHDLSTLLFPQYHPPARVAFINSELERSISCASHIITDSAYIERQIIARYPDSQGRITTVHLGADEAFRPRDAASCKAVLSRYGLSYKGYYLSVCTIEPRKNLVNQLLAFEKCHQLGWTSKPLLVVGDPGWNSKAEHELINRLTEKGIVCYLGFLPETALPYLFSAARALLFASTYEGFGLPALEALHSGTPVLTTEGSAMAEFCQEAARYVDPTDIDAIAGELRELEEPALCDRLASLGLERAKHFTWQGCVQDTLRIYRRMHAQT